MQNKHWKIEKIGEYASLQGGFAYPSSSFCEAGVPVLKIQNIRLRDVVTNELSYVPERVAEETSRFFVQEGDVLISMTGSWSHQPNSVVGRVARYSGESNKYLINQRVGRFVIKNPQSLDLRYLFFALCDPERQESLVVGASGSANQANISGKQIESLRIPIPPIEEQKAIAKILSSLDDKIELNRRMNATLEAMARALFKAWFVDFEPVHANKENRPSTSASPEIAKLFPSDFENGSPKGWHVGTLSEIATNYRQNIDPTEIDAETPYVGLEHIPRKSLALTEWGTASKAESTKSDFRAKDILFGKLRPYFHKVVIAPVDGICSTDVLVVRPKEKYHFGQTAIHFSSEALVQYATQLSNGAKMPRTSWSDLARFETVIPSKEISESYTTFVTSIVKRILTNIREGKVLEEIRDSLLPKLISGKVRVN